jgi:ketosteroid isomerase-like protein
MPSATFDVLDIVVSGSPWNTSIATAVAVHATLADGSSYENIFNQFMHMKWGRVTEIRTLENTEVLQRAMDRLAAGGYEEAHAVPITDEPATWPSHK